MTDNSTENVGLTLKAQREKLGYSLESAAQHTRIRKAHLESIEKNQFDDLPGQVYVTGFIRVYSRYLGLESNSLLSQLEEIRKDDVCSSLEPGAVTRLHSRRSSRSFGGEGRNAIVFGSLAVLVVGIAIYFLSISFQNDDPDEAASHQALSAKDSGPRQGDATTAEQQAVQQVISVSQETEMKSDTEEAKTPQQKRLPLVPGGGSSLRILALADSSLIIYIDDRKPDRYELHDGLDLTWKIKEKVMVELSGTGVARFWLGGKELDLGDVKTFQLQQAEDE